MTKNLVSFPKRNLVQKFAAKDQQIVVFELFNVTYCIPYSVSMVTNIKKCVPSLLGTLYEAKNAAQAYAKTDGGYEKY